MSKRLNQQKLLEALLRRIWLLSNQKEPLIARMNDEVIFELRARARLRGKELKLNEDTRNKIYKAL